MNAPDDPDAPPPSEDFAHALEAFERSAAGTRGTAETPAPGTRVRARVVAIGDAHVILDYGGRSEAVAETRHFRNAEGELRVKPGDTVDMVVVPASSEAPDAVVLSPSVRPEPQRATSQLREAMAAAVPVSGRVTAVNAGGLTVDVAGARAFCPVSQIDSGYVADPSVYVGRTLEFLVAEVRPGKGGAVLSRRKLLKRGEEERARQLLAELKPGDERDGTVARLEPFGAFVDLGGVDGLVHVSEIRHERTRHPSDALTVGEHVRVRVLKIENDARGKTRIALSIRAATPDPWTTAGDQFRPGMRVHGVVARGTEFGTFVTLAPGIDGLVHLSQMPARGGRLTPGQEVDAVVLNVDPARRRIALSMREPGERTPEAAAPAPEAERRRGPADTGEPTTMAIALRKAREKAREREQGG